MKCKHLAAFCALLLFCLPTGCAKAPEKAAGLRVAATSFPVYDLARAVGGDCISLTLLCDPGTELHDFDPTPADAAALAQADVFLYVGGESDVWANRMLAEKGTGVVCRLLDAVAPLAEDGEADEPDEHIWTDPMRAADALDEIARVFSLADPAHAALYAAGAAAYGAKLAKLDAAFRDLTARATDPFLLLADRFPFRYFTAAYDIPYAAAFAGCDDEGDPSAATVARLLEQAETHRVRRIFKLELSNGRLAEALAEQTGATVATLYAGQSVSRADFDAGVTCADLMARNLQTLREAWNA